MVRLEKAVPGDADFQSAKLYRVSTLHQDLAARELANVTLTVEFYDDPNKAIDVLAAAGIKAFEKCRPPREL